MAERDGWVARLSRKRGSACTLPINFTDSTNGTIPITVRYRINRFRKEVGRTTSKLLDESPAERIDETWREKETTGRTTVVITPSGIAAIGIESENEPSEPSRKNERTGMRQ